MDTVEELNGTYFYKGYTQLTPQQLWWLITVDALREHLGISVADAVLIASGQPWLPTRQKPGTATPGTSIASRLSRKYLDKPLPKGIRLPTLVGETPQRLHISYVNNWGKFIGRNVPWLGYALSAWTIYAIGRDVKDRFKSRPETGPGWPTQSPSADQHAHSGCRYASKSQTPLTPVPVSIPVPFAIVSAQIPS